MACPNEQRLLDYVDGALPAADHDAVDAHVDRCRRCQMAVAQLVDEGEEPDAATEDEPRYSIERELGAGAMGIVYEAIDRQLGRRVALKMIRPRNEDGSSRAASANDRNRLRIAREGRALARLDHPNIVSIYDIGTIDRETYVAMQYVDGVTLRSELEAGALDWRRAVDLAIAIADAVAAAHSVGVVHRDLKPDNVMLEGGTPKVLDFGLAHTAEEPLTEDVSTLVSHDALMPIDVTASGIVVGTPAYMAPEAMVGAPPDERSDQYSLVVMLFEMVYGRRPFRGASLAELYRAKRRRITERADEGPSPPRWLRRLIDRGLSPQAEDRFGDLPELAAALRRGRQPSGRRAGVVIGGSLLGVALALTVGDGEAMCRGAAQRVAAVYTDADREAIAHRFGTTAMTAALDEYAERWAAVHTRTCTAAWVDDELSLAELDAVTTCLDAELQSMATVVEAATRATAGATELQTALGELEDCERLADGDIRDRSPFRHALIERLARANTLGTLGYDAEAAEVAQPIAEQARRVGLPDVEAQARFIVGIARQNLQHFEDSAVALRDAYFGAGRSEEHALAAKAASSLAYVVGWGQGDGEAAMRWLSHADAASERAGVPADESLSLVVTRGLLLDLVGRPDEALRYHRRALVLSETPLPNGEAGAAAEHLGGAHANLANALAALEEPEQAAVHYRTAVEIGTARFGASHPSTLTAELNAALFVLEQGRNEEALEAFDAIEPRILSTPMPSLRSRLLGARGIALRRLGRDDEAVECQAAALSLSEQVYGEGHPQVATDSLNLSVALQAAGRCDEALAAAQRSQQLVPAATSVDSAEIHIAIARALACLDHDARALEEAQAALDALGRDVLPSAMLVEALRVKAITAEHLGRRRDARAAFEHALSPVDVVDASDELREELLDGVMRLRA